MADDDPSGVKYAEKFKAFLGDRIRPRKVDYPSFSRHSFFTCPKFVISTRRFTASPGALGLTNFVLPYPTAQAVLANIIEEY